MRTPRTAAGFCCVGYQHYLSPVLSQCTLPRPLKEDVTLQWWNISPAAAVIRTDEHPWGPAWLSFKSAGAGLIPFKQNCICAAAQWWIWLFSLSLTTKEERGRSCCGEGRGICLGTMMKIKMDKQGNLWVLSSIPFNGLQLYKEMEISVNLYTVSFFRNTVASN